MLKNMKLFSRREVVTNVYTILRSCKAEKTSLCGQFHSCAALSNTNNTKDKLAIIRFSDFEETSEKSKGKFMDLIHIYEGRHQQRRGHVEFIYAAMKHMEEFGVEKDVEVYKALLDVMPKGKFIPTNMFQVEFMHYPKQQQCAIDLLEKMENHGVIPDMDMEPMLLNIFGRKGYPLRKYWRMMYWMPKMKNLSPWPVPKPPPSDPMSLARLAVQRITSVDLQTKVHTWHADDVDEAVDKTWIVSGQSPAQVRLLEQHKETKLPVIVEAGTMVWLRDAPINYCLLKADPLPLLDDEPPPDIDDVSQLKVPYLNEATSPSCKKSIHEQDDGTVFAVCATGTSSKDSLLSWVRLLERFGNPALGSIPILFRFRSPDGSLTPFSDSLDTHHHHHHTS